MSKEEQICQNCGENIEDEIYTCYECGNEVCDICSNICSNCDEYFCDGCFAEHEKNCK
ncbi:MAG: hypothetical protein ACFFAN_02260 [Promethearchaeota archaeon]